MEETSKSNSFFQDIRSRELKGFRVRKRSYMDTIASGFTELGAFSVEHCGQEAPPMAISFCKTMNNCHIVAVSDEDGYVSLFDTCKTFPSSSSHGENSEKAKLSDWVAHQNAIFDICWIKGDTHMLTASGDQTIRLWDAQEKKCTKMLTGHRGSVKSLSLHPANSDILVSGSRDGAFALWDLRCDSRSKSNEVGISSTAMVKGAHLSPQAKRVRNSNAASMSITSVIYLKDEVSIATAGATDSVLKFWDTRSLKSQVTQSCPPQNTSTGKETRSHGISSLSQDLSGVFLTASCMDNRIYLYNILQLGKGPMQSFSGCRIESFFVKSAISPDATRVLSGSSDGNAYIWKMSAPMDPIALRGHDGEVTAVDWSPADFGKVATSSDDFTVRTWNPESSYGISSDSPSSNRRRIMAFSSDEWRKLLSHDEINDQGKSPENLKSKDEQTMPVVGTPESRKIKFASVSNSIELSDKTPEATMKSPSSVLNPPSSLKRTIKDYFLSS